MKGIPSHHPTDNQIPCSRINRLKPVNSSSAARPVAQFKEGATATAVCMTFQSSEMLLQAAFGKADVSSSFT